MTHSPTKQTLGLRKIALIVLAALLMKASLPGNGVPELAFLAMVPFLLALHGLRPVSACQAGLLYGFLIWSLCILWVPETLILKLQAPPLMIWSIYFLFCALFALPYGAYSVLASQFGWYGSLNGAVKSALCLTVFVSFFPYPLPGNLAHSLYNRPLFIQLADLGGVPLVLFAILLVNECWALMIRKRYTDRKGAVHAFSCGIIVLALMAGYGALRLAQFEEPHTAQPVQVHVGAIQPNIPLNWRETNLIDPELLAPLFAQSKTLTEQNQLDLLVWPEIPVPFSYTESRGHQYLVDTLVKQTGVPLLLSSGYIYEESSHPSQARRYYNAAEYITEQGQAGRYYKRRLSPFSEHLPFEQTFPWLRKIFPRSNHYIPGFEAKVFPLGRGIKAIPLICYESVFSDLPRQAVLEMGGNLLINQVNDAWFGDTSGSEIHLSLALFRSIEYRRPMVRVANSGTSVMINASGIMQEGKKTPLFAESAISAKLTIFQNITFYAQYGNLLLWGLIGLLVLLELIAYLQALRPWTVRLGSSPVSSKF